MVKEFARGEQRGDEESQEIEQATQEGKEARGYQAADAGGASRSVLNLFAK
jgi:hypothetical protein